MDNKKVVNIVLSKRKAAKGLATLTHGKTKTTLIITIKDRQQKKNMVTVLEFLKDVPTDDAVDSLQYDAIRLDSINENMSASYGGHILLGEKQHEGGVPLSV